MKKIKFDKYLLLCIITTIIGFSIIFACSGVYPFGNRMINLVDFDDGYIPVYYKLWDVLHFKSTALFDWNLGSGLNAFGSLIGNGFISPLCWIIALFNRSSIPFTISYVYLLKIVFISTMTYIAIGKIFPKTEGIYKLLFTQIYTFSCFMFIMSTNLLYLDAIAIFPLFVYSLKELIEKGHWKLYVVLLTATLLMSYYIAWLDLVFLTLTSGFALLLSNVDNKKEKAAKVFVCTLISLLLSCVLFLPGFMFARSSARMANNTSDDGIFSFFVEKSSYLFTLAIPFVLSIKQLFVHKDKKINKFILVMMILLLLGVFIEPINAMWHTGSHSGFPLRYGYQINFFLILVSIYYINNNYKPKKETNNNLLLVPIFIMINILGIFFLTRKPFFDNDYFASGAIQIPCYLTLLFVFFVYIICYVFILKNDKKKAILLTTVLVVIQSLTFGYLYLQFLPIRSSAFVQELANSFDLVNDHYNYTMNYDVSNINFPYILKVPSIENRIHFVEQYELDQRDYLGFSGHDTYINSAGGNLFTNALMQNKYYLSENKMNEKYYDLIDEKNGNYYYKAKSNLSYLIPYNSKEYNEQEKDYYKNSNQIYKTLFDGQNNIFDSVDARREKEYIVLNVKKDKTYNAILQYDVNQINKLIEDEVVFSLIEYDEDNLLYFEKRELADNRYNVSFLSKIDGEIKLDVSNLNVDFVFYEVNDEEFNKFIENYGNLDVSVETNGSIKTYTYEAKEDSSVLLPINYTSNYEVRVNGEKVDYKCNLYNMLSIDVKKGTNKIEVEYKQKWFSLGIKITIVTLICLIVLNIINKKYRFLNYKIILYPLFILSFISFIALFLKIYVLTLI